MVEFGKEPVCIVCDKNNTTDENPLILITPVGKKCKGFVHPKCIGASKEGLQEIMKTANEKFKKGIEPLELMELFSWIHRCIDVQKVQTDKGPTGNRKD